MVKQRYEHTANQCRHEAATQSNYKQKQQSKKKKVQENCEITPSNVMDTV